MVSEVSKDPDPASAVLAEPLRAEPSSEELQPAIVRRATSVGASRPGRLIGRTYQQRFLGGRGMAQCSAVARLTSLRGVTHLGSYPIASGQFRGLDLIFTTEGVELRKKRSVLGELSWGRIRRLEADNREALEHRLTVARMVLSGLSRLLPRRNRSCPTSLSRTIKATGSSLFPG